MNWDYQKILTAFQKGGNSKFFKESKHGLERECLRIQPNGSLAMTDHPKTLGSALMHPYITTDFSEAQLELRTPPLNSEKQALKFLENVHLFANKNLKNELIWPLSMPCELPKESKIPIANYGRSPLGQKKTLYRLGLTHRYGAKMQTVSGTHYNFSFSENFWQFLAKVINGKSENLQDFISESYFHLIRNFLRYGWLNTYLFGAAPAVCRSYLNKKVKPLKRFWLNTFYAPYGTSLRMSGLGYYSRVQGKLAISFNNIDDYIKDLKYAVSTPSPSYKNLPGLNDHILQMEAEHYSRIRPKTLPDENQTVLDAMAKKGVKYLEMRSVDINPYSEIGLDIDQMHFLHVFAIYCLFKSSPPLSLQEQKCLTENQNRVALYGRDPKHKILCIGKEKLLSNFGKEILEELRPIASILNRSFETNSYTENLGRQLSKLEKPDLTPSAKILNDILGDNQKYLKFGVELAQKHTQNFFTQKLNKNFEQNFRRLAEKSLKDQERLEVTYDYYLEGYEDLELSTQLLIREAKKQNIEVEVLDSPSNFIKLQKGRKLEYIRQATKTSKDSYVASEIMGNKQVSKILLKNSGINVPEGDQYTNFEDAVKDYPRYKNLKIVVKPTTTNYGIGINIVAKNDQMAFEEALKDAFKYDQTVLIEEFVAGQECRFLVVGGKIVSVLKRVAANVVGDGKHNIEQLAEIKNNDFTRFKSKKAWIRLGKIEKAILSEQKLTFKSIPKKGQQVFLRKNSNVSTGGDPIDVSDQIPEKFNKIALDAARAVDGHICGIDMIINGDDYSIIETNYNPSLYIHEVLYDGKPQNTPKAVLKYLGF